jgi:hypothetical protein
MYYNRAFDYDIHNTDVGDVSMNGEENDDEWIEPPVDYEITSPPASVAWSGSRFAAPPSSQPIPRLTPAPVGLVNSQFKPHRPTTSTDNSTDVHGDSSDDDYFT